MLSTVDERDAGKAILCYACTNESKTDVGGGYKMKASRLFAWMVLVVSLFAAFPVSAAEPSGSIGIYSVAACKDSTIVAVVGSSTYANNRVGAAIFYQDAEGQDVLLKQLHTSAFGAGSFSLALSLPYVKKTVAAGTVLRVEVRLQRLSGKSYVDVGHIVNQYVTAPDKNCFGLCTVTLDTTDAAPSDGTITLRSHYGSWFRPEGWLHGAVPVRAGQRVRATFIGLSCEWSVRAWYYPKTGDKTPKMLPAQYWPYEYQANDLDGTNPYVTSFASGLPPTHPLEEDDLFVAK
jgi:hypothetical protein